MGALEVVVVQALAPFSDKASFKSWLEGRNVAWAQVLAARVAMRVLPLVNTFPEIEGDTSDTSLAAVRACHLSWAARLSSSNPLLRPALAAAESLSTKRNPAAQAAGHAAVAVYARDAKLAYDAAVKAATASVDSVSSKTEGIDIWASLSRDAQQLEAGMRVEALARGILWIDDEPSWSRDARSKMVRLLKASDPNWQPWIGWYEDRIRGAMPDEEIELARATVPDAVWRMGVAAVNSHIERNIGTISKQQPQSDSFRLKSGKLVKGNPNTGKRSEKAKPPPPVETLPPLPRGVASGVDARELLPDAPSSSVDFLNRAPLAFVLAGRINQIHNSQKKLHTSKGGEAPASFVIHIDAPWGGGKTSFASYLTQILNHTSTGGQKPEWLRQQPLDNEQKWPKEFRRPWFIVHFDAWRNQHNDPPWWTFYQTMRQQIGQQWSHPQSWRGLSFLYRAYKLARHGIPEMLWRLSTPDIQKRAIVSLLSLFVIWLIWKFVPIKIDAAGKITTGETAGILPTLIAALLGSASILWTVIQVVTSTLVPGTPDAAKNYSLGSGDPLNRIRKHFAKVMRRYDRPVLVIVDDLDRCDPKFVVELVRGMQTILRSERVIYLLLGDRDWITQSFSVMHKNMEGIEVGPEHEFGQRFMEKAIQFSFVLPEISADERKTYTRRILGVEDPKTVSSLEEEPDLQKEFEDLTNIQHSQDRETAAMDFRSKVRERGLMSEALEHMINLELSQRSAADNTAETATRNRLEGMAHVLPANPRQIKRIINTITYLQEVARLEANWQPGSPEWQMLARWIVLMIEWPRSWFTLSRNPRLVDELYNATPTSAVARKIQSCVEVMALLDFKRASPESDWKESTISSADVRKLAELLPATSGEALKVAEEKAA